MRAEPEPGSVIAERVYIAEKSLSLGQVKRTCELCGKDWIGPDFCRQGDCRSIMFSEKDVRPSPMMTILGRGLTAVAEPPKPKVVADPTDLQAICDLRAALVE